MSSDYHSCPMRAYDETQEYLLANPELKEAIVSFTRIFDPPVTTVFDPPGAG